MDDREVQKTFTAALGKTLRYEERGGEAELRARIAELEAMLRLSEETGRAYEEDAGEQRARADRLAGLLKEAKAEFRWIAERADVDCAFGHHARAILTRMEQEDG